MARLSIMLLAALFASMPAAAQGPRPDNSAAVAGVTVAGVTVAGVARANILGGATLTGGRVSDRSAGDARNTASAPSLSLVTRSEQACDPAAPPACRILIIDLP